MEFAFWDSANLANANLSGSYWYASRLGRANLTGANLNSVFGEDTGFSEADLTGATLVDAWFSYIGDDGNGTFRGSILRDANLTNVRMSGFMDMNLADLTNAILHDADLRNVDLEGANVGGADFSGANLRNARNLGLTIGGAFYDPNTIFTGTGFDPASGGWTLVPEPSTALLLGCGLAGLGNRRKRTR